MAKKVIDHQNLPNKLEGKYVKAERLGNNYEKTGVAKVFAMVNFRNMAKMKGLKWAYIEAVDTAPKPGQPVLCEATGGSEWNNNLSERVAEAKAKEDAAAKKAEEEAAKAAEAEKAKEEEKATPQTTEVTAELLCDTMTIKQMRGALDVLDVKWANNAKEASLAKKLVDAGYTPA